jgi:hypothetical protein
VVCRSATLGVLGSQHPVHVLGPQPGQLVLTPAGVRIGAVEADHDVRLGPASRLGGPVVLAQLGRVGIPIFEQVFHERQPARTLAGAGRRAEVSARAAA